jgi:amino acid permease
MLIATEATAAALIIEYWTKAVPVGAWIAIVLAGVYSLH